LPFVDFISIKMKEHFLGVEGEPQELEIKVQPVPWPVPSIESLWLGVKPENRQRRMKAFLSCMGIETNHELGKPGYIEERYMLICVVLRYVTCCNTSEIVLG